MKIGIFKMTTLTLLLTCACATILSGCRSDQGIDGSSGGVVAFPHGYMARLEQVHDGRMIGFGSFMGYYFRPENPRDLNRLRFVCFNENRFYSSDMPDGAKLYEGMAVRVKLPQADITIPAKNRINPVFFQEAPDAWLYTRPEPQDDFVHFHSCYDGTGPVLIGGCTLGIGKLWGPGDCVVASERGPDSETSSGNVGKSGRPKGT
jgi:hypothetical protein